MKKTKLMPLLLLPLIVFQAKTWADPSQKGSKVSVDYGDGDVPLRAFVEVQQCLPKLDLKGFKKAPTMDKLREIIDRQMIVMKKELRARRVLFREPEGVLKRLRLASQKNAQQKLDYYLTLQKYGANEMVFDLPVPQEHVKNPEVKVINSYFAAAEMLEDERDFLEVTKDGTRVLAKLRKDELFSLELRPPGKKHSLYCERKNSMVVYCSCSSE